LVAAGALIGWSFISKKIGKQRVYFIGIGVWLIVEIGIFWVTEHTPIWVMYATTPFAALGVSVGSLSIPPILFSRLLVADLLASFF